MNEKALTIMIPEEIYNQLQERKEKTGATITFQVNDLLRKGLENADN